MKKLVSLWLAAALVFSALVFPAGAVSAPTLSQSAVNKALAAAQPEEDPVVEGRTGFQLSKAVITSLTEENRGITLKLSAGEVALSPAALTALSQEGKEPVTITLTALTEDQAPKGGRSPVSLTVSVGRKEVSQLPAGEVKLTLPWDNAGDAPLTAAVWVNEEGKPMAVGGSAVADNALKVLPAAAGIYAAAQWENPFLDIDTHWAKEDITFAAGRGLLVGMSYTSFSPDLPVTGAMAVTVLGRLNGIPDPETPMNWAKPHLAWAKEEGLLPQGFSENDPLPREQLAYILAHYLKLEAEAEESLYVPYRDQTAIRPDCRASVEGLRLSGIMEGRETGFFDPQGYLTRAELAAVMGRIVTYKLS